MSSTTADEYAGHHRHCYIREGQHCSCGRQIPGVYADRPACTCLGLPMGKGQECHAHQLHEAGPRRPRPETTLDVQQPEPVTMFRLDPAEGGAFDLTLTTWTERGYEWGVFRLDPRIASAFKAAVSREMAEVPSPPPLTWDDLMRTGREIGCAMSVNADLPAVLGPALSTLLTTDIQRVAAAETFAAIAVDNGPDVARAWMVDKIPYLGDETPLSAIVAGRGQEVLAAARAYARGDHAN
ncbi:hypothetical protein EST92_11565 [Streptomyces sp. TM32]|uniref:hypothetical protein n=1 Tax=Streptomyces sp. TM32 TaxID=1652669 RepID=UPI001013B7A4|nr:hypothetical protein [Streptomyces sp. TM32]RXS84189.1 hypothetical protein EST92_11565 [Streptomyces sp. TM32]